MSKPGTETLETHSIIVQIGNDEAVLYHLRQTRAPKDYDGFGTIELADAGGEYGRLVLIRDQHYDWQSSRYSSGFFACAVPVEFDRGDAQSFLWERINHGGKS
jgi:hypothetical protein